ncbi:hypothetical protein RND71_009259 [Anisodus tanguticus]|uniref:Uncharacterized protein n=1 Tax=Anisodus tanguticus TaxID=243964 RepID=A0AAE1SHP2_9SOLA|nr:hypothetical protein RND71_009259 [Anisodus tanguticus]
MERYEFTQDSSPKTVCDVDDIVGPEPTKSHIIAQISSEPGDFREVLGLRSFVLKDLSLIKCYQQYCLKT